ncbi:MAG: tRNA (adenosine(37)-N6)-threonylcarbamoyltransferase complex dimerization subunit type 1 TsaB [Bacteroidales bacterium]|nr:tRNA (adenosine(37)-N6)-threonylcarbamoyltransferase complex dimerization subunit type 1 TsaB [Bacteroidales bacterium]
MRFILIEISTSLCSAAIAEDGVIVSVRESTGTREHASLTAPYVKEMLDERGLKVSDCDAVCVSMGPGSYTGLRVGVSTAKGLCFGAGIPLLAVDTMEILYQQGIDAISGAGICPGGEFRYIVPMIDARRMEVYAAVYSAAGERLTEIEPQVVTPESFAPQLEEGPVLFIGDGALKCKDVLSNPNAFFVEACPRASAMLRPAERAFKEGKFQDVAYFEPLYIKQFIAKVSTKNVLV